MNMAANRNMSENCCIPRFDRSADGGRVRLRPQKMLKHLLLHSIAKDFIGALGVLNFSKDTLRVLFIAVAPERLDLFSYAP